MDAPERLNKSTRGQGQTGNYPRLLGGSLCLDYANTVEARLSDRPEEFLTEYADVIRWAFHAGILDQEETSRLLRGLDGGHEAALFSRAVELRDAVYRVFRAVGTRLAPAPEDVQLISDEYQAGLPSAILTRQDGNWKWEWRRRDDPTHPLWEIAASAIDLLANGDLTRIKECPGANDCGWLYYDSSRNRTRRWCSMEGCGSRVKMRRHYARQKATSVN